MEAEGGYRDDWKQWEAPAVPSVMPQRRGGSAYVPPTAYRALVAMLVYMQEDHGCPEDIADARLAEAREATVKYWYTNQRFRVARVRDDAIPSTALPSAEGEEHHWQLQVCFADNDTWLIVVPSMGKVQDDGVDRMRKHIVSIIYTDPLVGSFRGRDRLYENVTRQYWGISRRQVMSAAKLLPAYQRQVPNARLNPQKLQPYGTGHWQIDGAYMRAGRGRAHPRGFILIVDRFSRWLWGKVMYADPSGENVARYLMSLFLVEGPPRFLHSDRGPEFRNATVQNLCARMGVQPVYSKAYRPQSTGAIERANQTIKRALYSAMVTYSTSAWQQYFDPVLFSYNCTRHSVTRSSPFELQRGYSPDISGLTGAFDRHMPRVRYNTRDTERQMQGCEEHGESMPQSSEAALRRDEEHSEANLAVRNMHATLSEFEGALARQVQLAGASTIAHRVPQEMQAGLDAIRQSLVGRWGTADEQQGAATGDALDDSAAERDGVDASLLDLDIPVGMPGDLDGELQMREGRADDGDFLIAAPEGVASVVGVSLAKGAGFAIYETEASNERALGPIEGPLQLSSVGMSGAGREWGRTLHALCRAFLESSVDATSALLQLMGDPGDSKGAVVEWRRFKQEMRGIPRKDGTRRLERLAGGWWLTYGTTSNEVRVHVASFGAYERVELHPGIMPGGATTKVEKIKRARHYWIAAHLLNVVGIWGGAPLVRLPPGIVFYAPEVPPCLGGIEDRTQARVLGCAMFRGSLSVVLYRDFIREGRATLNVECVRMAPLDSMQAWSFYQTSFSDLLLRLVQYTRRQPTATRCPAHAAEGDVVAPNPDARQLCEACGVPATHGLSRGQSYAEGTLLEQIAHRERTGAEDDDAPSPPPSLQMLLTGSDKVMGDELILRIVQMIAEEHGLELAGPPPVETWPSIASPWGSPPQVTWCTTRGDDLHGTLQRTPLCQLAPSLLRNFLPFVPACDHILATLWESELRA